MKRKTREDDVNTRIAIVNGDRCNPNICNLQCKKKCFVVMQGKNCVVVEKESKKTVISEILCVGCGICVGVCPFDALRIINLPRGIPNMTIHRYGANMFKLFTLPTPKAGQVLGIVGTNGLGKTTALQILNGKTFKPNLGLYNDPPQWTEILKHFKGSGLHSFFTKVLEEDYITAFKPQYVDLIPKQIKKGKIRDIIAKKDEKGEADYYVKRLELGGLLERDITVLSGGELQRFAILITLLKDARVYIIDEPTSYLDVKQRLVVSDLIREMA